MDNARVRAVTPFHTLDPMEGEGFTELISALESGSNDQFNQFLTNYPEVAKRMQNSEIDTANGIEGLKWDNATIIFLTYRALKKDGSPAEPLDRGISMERIGRFPSKDGNAIEYFRKNHIPAEEDLDLSRLLDQLDIGLREEIRGGSDLSEGFGGLHLHGWLTSSDVTKLRLAMQKTAWSVAKDELYDGGVRDVARHLLIILKNAEKRGNGIIMRSHS